MMFEEHPLAVRSSEMGHRFGAQPVFAGLTFDIAAGSECLVRGCNGSGKSTLGTLIAGEQSPSDGRMRWFEGGVELPADDVLLRTMRVGPSTSLHPDLTVQELVHFQSRFRKWNAHINPIETLKAGGFTATAFEKRYRELSSGMQQRVKISLALASRSGLVVLDEPCANLDAEGKGWYQHLLQSVQGTTTLVICSNNRPEDCLKPDQIIELDAKIKNLNN